MMLSSQMSLARIDVGSASATRSRRPASVIARHSSLPQTGQGGRVVAYV
jgi:hypothetical protein